MATGSGYICRPHPESTGGGGTSVADFFPNDGKIYGVRNDLPVEIVHPESSGGAGDGWTYTTIVIPKGAFSSGDFFGSVISHAAAVYPNGARTIIASRAAAVSGAKLQLYSGSDMLMQANLDGTTVQQMIGADFQVPAGQTIDIRILGNSGSLSGPITVRLATKAA